MQSKFRVVCTSLCLSTQRWPLLPQFSSQQHNSAAELEVFRRRRSVIILIKDYLKNHNVAPTITGCAECGGIWHLGLSVCALVIHVHLYVRCTWHIKNSVMKEFLLGCIIPCRHCFKYTVYIYSVKPSSQYDAVLCVAY